jgi:hypothetical protein
MVHHGADGFDGQPLAARLPHVEEKHRQPLGALFHLLARRGAREQKHQVGMLRPRGPDFLPVHHVAVAVAHRGGAQRQRVGAGGGFGDAERLQPQLAPGDRRQILLFLFGAAVPEQRAHGVHLRVAGGAVAAGGVYLLHDRGRRLHVEPAAAVFLRNERGEKAGLGQRGHEFARIAALAVELAPIFAGEFCAQRPHRGADLDKLFRFDHARTSARPLFMTTALRSFASARKLTTAPSRQISVRMVSPGNTGAENRPPNDTSRAGS